MKPQKKQQLTNQTQTPQNKKNKKKPFRFSHHMAVITAFLHRDIKVVHILSIFFFKYLIRRFNI